jgi:uncharacterized protein (TIGR00297 family)
MSIAAAVALAGGLALIGRALGWLTVGGAVAAALVGSAVFSGAGLPGAALLALFFVSGSLLTYALGPVPGALDAAPGKGRTARQVTANGGWAGLGALAVAAGSAAGWPLIIGALAAAQADTWATEIGMRSGARPRLITTGRPVPPGTSGGITARGTLGGLLGAAAMAGLALALGASGPAAAAGAAGGAAGLVLDSLLGASWQAMYRCESCGADTECAVHRCGLAARLVRGWDWLDNDAVNLAASGAGAGVGLGVWLLALYVFP